MKITLLILAALEVASCSPSLSVLDLHVPPSPQITTVTHKKEPNGGYKKGSPLYNKQERLEAKVAKHHSKQPLVGTLPKHTKKHTEAASAQPSRSMKPSFWTTLISVGVYAILVLAFAVAYRKKAGSLPRRDKLGASPKDLPAWTRCGFTFSLFDCGGLQTDWPICLAAFFCPIVQWASTASSTASKTMTPFMGYWKAVGLLLVLACLGPFTFGMTGLVIMFILLKRRRELRKAIAEDYGVDLGFRSWVEDICLVFCCNSSCLCCQLVQEAREVNYYTPSQTQTA